MFLRIIKISGYFLLVIFVITTLSFTVNRSKNVTCRDIQIKFVENEVIKISTDEIIRLVKSSDAQLLGKKINEIHTEKIERSIESHEAILNAEVYTIVAKDSTAYKGIVAVKVKHREPVVRIMSSSGSYFLDKYAGKIPVSSNYTANVYVATGHFTEKYAKEKLLPLILFIEKDEFWNAQIEQIHIENDGNVLITPLIGNHIIELGKVDDYELKLRNMKAFYKQVFANNNWNKYKLVSLKYRNQIVAKKR